MTSQFRQKLSPEQMERWAVLTSDYNPMHLDPEFTRATQYGRPIAYATLTLAVVSEALEQVYGSGWTDGGVLDVRFVGPALVGEEFSVLAEMRDGEPKLDCRSGNSSPMALTLKLAKTPKPQGQSNGANDLQGG